MTEQLQKVVTIDGPAGSGKGTIGQRLALKLGWHFLDSGALYRACAYIAREYGLADNNSQTIVSHLICNKFVTMPVTNGNEAKVLINDKDISRYIRTAELGQLASKLAADATIRSGLLQFQRNYLREPGLVADGRDMGTVVFSNAFFKVFLTADLSVRAKRKFKQLKNKEIHLKYDKIYTDLQSRDLRDSTRTHAPLRPPKDALTIDTSSMNIEEVVEFMLIKIELALNEKQDMVINEY